MIIRNLVICNIWFVLFTNCACFFLTSGYNAPELRMNVTDVIQYYGYPFEIHEVTTEDGYILSMQRIPFGVKNKKTPRQVVFLQHGLLDSAFTWITNGPRRSLAFILADNGFDVWLCNSRGNLYSKRHIRYPSSSKKFWDFSWDEMATYDLPAAINYALSVSKAKKLSYIGHSQGTEIGFAQFSKNTDLNSKVSAFVALAPVAYMGHIRTPIKHIAKFSRGISFFLKLFSNGEFLPNRKFMTRLKQIVCGVKIVSRACGNIAFLLQGFNVKNLNLARMPIYLSHIPAGTSIKNINHYAQSYLSNKFQYYDYGLFGNMIHYKKRTPPEYKLNTNGLPVAIFYGGNDLFSDKRDVNRAINELGDNVRFKKYIPKYNHLDFVWGINAVKCVYVDVIKFLNRYKE